MDAALRAIAEPHRREIIRLVWSGELPAGEIADRFKEVSRPAISQHLRVLRDAGLLSERRDGTRRLYRTRRDRIQQLRAALPENVYVQVDGGVDNDNVRSVYDAGASLIVAGTTIFGREDLPRSYRRLVQALA